MTDHFFAGWMAFLFFIVNIFTQGMMVDEVNGRLSERARFSYFLWHFGRNSVFRLWDVHSDLFPKSKKRLIFFATLMATGFCIALAKG